MAAKAHPGCSRHSDEAAGAPQGAPIRHCVAVTSCNQFALARTCIGNADHRNWQPLVKSHAEPRDCTSARCYRMCWSSLASWVKAETLYADKTDQELTQLAAGWEALSEDATSGAADRNQSTHARQLGQAPRADDSRPSVVTAESFANRTVRWCVSKPPNTSCDIRRCRKMPAIARSGSVSSSASLPAVRAARQRDADDRQRRQQQTANNIAADRLIPHRRRPVIQVGNAHSP